MILYIALLSGTFFGQWPDVRITCPDGARPRLSDSGLLYTPMVSFPLSLTDAHVIEWNELLMALGVDAADLGPLPTSDKLPSEDGREIVNPVAFYREALADQNVVTALAERNPLRIPPRYVPYVAPLLYDASLRRRNWNPTTGQDDDGMVVLRSPWVQGDHRYYVGAVFLPGDLRSIKRHEWDYRSQLSDLGQDYVDIWPVEGTIRRGRNQYGAFNTRGVFILKKLQWPLKLAYYQWFIDHDVDGTLMVDFMATAERFSSYIPMKWMRGRVVFLSVTQEATLVGYIVIPFVGFQVEVEIPHIATFTDKPKDHQQAMRAFLGNWKRKVEGWTER